MPSSPPAPAATRPPVQPWPDLEDEWLQYLKDNSSRSILSPNKRLNMLHHLKYPHARTRGATKDERNTDNNLKNWTLSHFELQDNQIYWKPELDHKTGKISKVRYAACDRDTMDLIQKVHVALHYFAFKPADLTITPIILKGLMRELVVDLMDFTKESDGNMNWVSQKKEPFTKFIWLKAFPDKAAGTTGADAEDWFETYGNPRRARYDNGTEFRGQKPRDFEQVCKARGIPIIRGRAYHPDTQGTVEIANRTFKRRLAAVQTATGTRDWVRFLPEIAMIINTTINESLPNSMTPYEAWYGRTSPNWDEYARRQAERRRQEAEDNGEVSRAEEATESKISNDIIPDLLRLTAAPNSAQRIILTVFP
ncbi:uncharacterized protein PAC_14630 [Phialocephala subalpina]|uniref:Integrase catalytic domain-containing protein n=1 Tax=Phialocephala subalpina TaxID=576137 RepID=A0A1L7XI75_9HELO|nr:uncharacterized protein PAC_14630 [Phialocephala subalpina]